MASAEHILCDQALFARRPSTATYNAEISPSKVAQRLSTLPEIVYKYQMYLSIFLKESAQKYSFIIFKNSLQLYAV